MINMTQKSEFRYMIEFEDGFSSRLGVYGLDEKEVYGTRAFMGISIEVGDRVEPNTVNERDTDPIRVVSYAEVRATAVTAPFRVPLTEMQPNWEELINKGSRRQNMNSIRVESPDHVEAAIERHRQAYERQFKELTETLQDAFNAFIEGHPLYDFPDTREEQKDRLIGFSLLGETTSRSTVVKI